MNKYHSKKVTLGGIVFDSKKEAARYRELLLMERAGQIHSLRRQVPYELIPNQYQTDAKGKQKLIERKCVYNADFVYYENGREIVEDTKGMRTKDYIIKRKLMLHKYGVKIREI